MSQWKFVGTTAVLALLAGNPALAEVTPEQVWENWQSMFASYGQTVTVGAENRTGDTLVLSDVSVVAEQDGATASVAIAEISLRDQGDGTVMVKMSDTVPVTTVAKGLDGETADDVSFNMEVGQPGMEIVASGAAGEIRYDFTGPSMTIGMSEITAEGETVPMTMKIALNNVAGNYIVKGETDKTISTSLTADDMTMAMDMAEPGGEGKLVFNGKVSGLSGQSTSTLLAEMDMTNLPAALAAGFGVDGAFAYTAGEYSFDFAADGDTATGNGSSNGGEFSVAMDKDKLGYGIAAKDVALTMNISSLPFPVNVSYGESAFKFLMPVSKSDAPGDFTVLTKIVDLAVSDEIWGMVDPTGNLPRDPLTVVLDAKGQAKLGVDLMDEAAMANLQGPPGELHALELTQLQVKGIGAEITGDGSLTFDNSDLATFGGMPAPTGTVNLKAVGVNGVMDKLVAMGMLPEDQVMGARMMMGMFAKAVEGEADTITSTLEFKDKHFFANGMQLQ
jgi:hypothetical protein